MSRMKAFLQACVFIVVALPAAAQSGSSPSLASLSTQPSMNVFRRFAVEPAKMAGFYAEVLGLKQLPSLKMPGGGQMMLFEIGSAQVKLQFTAAAGEYTTGRRARGHRVAGLHVLLSRRGRGHRPLRAARLSGAGISGRARQSPCGDGARPGEPVGRARRRARRFGRGVPVVRGRIDRVRSREEPRVLS